MNVENPRRCEPVYGKSQPLGDFFVTWESSFPGNKKRSARIASEALFCMRSACLISIPIGMVSCYNFN